MTVPNDPRGGAPSGELHVRIEHNLTNHPPNADAQRRMEALRETAKLLGHDIIDMTPTSREQSLAITHLEQTVMWAVAAIARDPLSQRDPNA